MFVKICGITSEEDGLLAVAMGADAVGFLFAPSPRRVSPATAAEIARRLPPEILTVGVFRNEDPRTVVRIANRARLRAVQLHGHETPAETKRVREQVGTVIKAFRAGSKELEQAREFGADIVLVDADQPGSGKVFDWALAERAAGSLPVTVGSIPPTSPRRSPRRAPGESTSRPVWSPRRVRRTHVSCAISSRRRVPPPGRRCPRRPRAPSTTGRRNSEPPRRPMTGEHPWR